ncbi:selenoprotein M [Patagioenas fasciata monilis]|uniref:Selenoprotein M n=1 Tax=Patagioenas fasciata monilis TaxID=372326 RepID=A0A1V4J2R0_PATFA|nr:selenoprotein M [Patagioenas fasciata monilis]
MQDLRRVTAEPLEGGEGLRHPGHPPLVPATAAAPLGGQRSYCVLLNTLPSHNLEMKHLPGADPELVLLSHRYEELERIPLSDMTREEINQLVQELGFYRKETPDAPVPEEFQFAPARPLPALLPHQAPTADGETPPEHDEGEHPEL